MSSYKFVILYISHIISLYDYIKSIHSNPVISIKVYTEILLGDTGTSVELSTVIVGDAEAEIKSSF